MLNSCIDPSRSTLTSIVDYTKSCEISDLNGMRIGVPRNSFPAKIDDVLMKDFEKGLRILESAGATVVDHLDFKGAAEYNALDSSVKKLVVEGSFKTDIETYLQSLATNPKKLETLTNLIDATKSEAREEYPARGIELWERAQKVDPASTEFKYALAKDEYFAREGGIPGIIQDNDLDAIAIPYMVGPAVTFAARGGTPLITVPLGWYPENTEVKLYQNSTVDVGPNVPFVTLPRLSTIVSG